MKGRTVIVTGASSGIGKALATHYAMLGANVVMGARKLDELERIAGELRLQGCQCIAVGMDVTSEDDCARLIRTAVAQYGRIDVLINNAGISMRALFHGIDLGVLRRLMDVNFWGAVHCTWHALPYLLDSRGSLVGVSSIAGFKGLPGRSGYSASKFALHGFLDVIRMEYHKQGLHVLLACPGFTASNIRNTALAADGSVQGESPRDEGKMMSAEEVARHIIRAVDKRRRTLILTGNGKLTVLLNKFFPSWMDKVVYRHMAKEPGSPFT